MEESEVADHGLGIHHKWLADIGGGIRREPLYFVAKLLVDDGSNVREVFLISAMRTSRSFFICLEPGQAQYLARFLEDIVVVVACTRFGTC